MAANDGFEESAPDAEPALTFPSWNEFDSDASSSVKNSAAIVAGSTVTGFKSAEIVAGSASGGAIRQSFNSAPTHFSVSLKFASLAPQSSAALASRYFSLQLKHGGDSSTAQINLRVVKNGNLEAFDGSSFVPVGSLVANFTADGGSLGAWDGETPVINSLKITGEYGSAPSYRISLNGHLKEGLTLFQGSPPAAGEGVDAVSFNGVLSTKNFIVDEVSMSSVADPPGEGTGLAGPEPIGPFLNGKLPSRTPGGAGGWTVTPTFAGLAVPFAMSLVPYPGSSTKLAVVEKRGRIITFNKGDTVTTTQVLLDIQSRIYRQGNSACGLMNVAFHPEFGQAGSPNRGNFYVLYVTQPAANGENAYWRLSRFTLEDGAVTANPSSEQILINQFDRDDSHDPGHLMFGPEGFLYFGCGDEGDSNDSHNNGQRLDHRLFSGVFRIDVDRDATRSHPIRRQPEQVAMPAGWGPSYTQNYFIPNDNPFVDPNGSRLEEFYAFGLRNPYRFTYDAVTGKWLVADVGQDLRDELDVLVPGGNYGWPFREGISAGPKPPPATIVGTLKEPLWDYGHDLGQCIIGGPIYRGIEHPSLLGKKIVVDNFSGRLWSVGVADAVVTQLTTMPSGSVYSGTTSIGTDAQGEPYFLKINGSTNSTVFYKLSRSGTFVPEPPSKLSLLGAFKNLDTLEPAEGVVPYEVNAPLWSDHADKFRWIAMPNDGKHDSASERIQFRPDEPWTFPPGTVFIKHFELPVNDQDPSVVRRLETRFVAVSSSGEPYGVTYKWRADGSDADLLMAGESETITIATGSGGTRSQTWTFPSRNDCRVCHNGNAGYVLGVNTHQLNRQTTYQQTGRSANQLETLASLGWFDSGYHPAHLPFFLKSAYIHDTSLPLELRVRSYLDANCSQCHRPNGVEAHFVGSSRVDLQACKLEYSIVSPK